MSIITFWNEDKAQSGQTLASVAFATRMAIDRNLKILLISTSYQEYTMRNCFWTESVAKKLKLDNKNNVAAESGMEGLARLINSNKLEPTVITDYTHVIFKNRLEVLSSFIGNEDRTAEEKLQDYDKMMDCYIDLIRTANQYYDIVIVDLDKRLKENDKQDILKSSDLDIYVLTQRLISIDNYNELRNNNEIVKSEKCIPVIGMYNRDLKYTKKNIMKYIDEKKDLSLVPFSTLYYSAAEETTVVDLFLRLKKIKDTEEESYFFMDEVKKLVDTSLNKIQELKRKRR